MRNLELTKEELEAIRLESKGVGIESNIYKATNSSLYKILKPCFMEVLENKKKKIEILYEMQIPFFKNPIRTLSFHGEFIGYEIKCNPDDIVWWKQPMKKEEQIYLLQDLKQKLQTLAKEKIIYGDLKDDNLLINKKTGELSFCDIDNIQLFDLKMDHVLGILPDIYNNHGYFDHFTHIYMHNIFTLNELVYHTNYKQLSLYLSEKIELFHSPFNHKGNQLIKKMLKQKKISPNYLIDHLKKVG